ncbi:MAG TPA: hypothetical protein VOA80_03090 [Thermoanaerobaculia bacterium]|nr:hypothetical protein [Thermoanaerobaculia bacterium]
MEITYKERSGTDRRVSLPATPLWRLRLRGLAGEIGWPPLCRDLIELATSVWIADRMVRRPRQGPRRIALSIPVRRPDRWREVAPELARVLSLLTQDDFDFTFRRATGGLAAVTYPPSASSNREITRVALFSGGLDSACAAASFAAAGLETAFVSQYTNGFERLRTLLAGIQSTYGGTTAPHHAAFYTSPVTTVARQLRERSQRSRSFLFLSLALATAAAVGAGEVLVCENGPLAVNLPLSLAMVPTRHAHSSFLLGMERLAQGLFPSPIKIFNPFELATKGEMATVFAPHPELALETVSCWNQQWASRRSSSGTRHCGWCLPCLVRRASLARAAIAVPPRHFAVDIRRLAEHHTASAEEMALLGPYRSLRGFAAEVAACASWRAFVRRFPDVVDSEPTAGRQHADRWFPDLFSLMKRFAAEVESALAPGSQP